MEDMNFVAYYLGQFHRLKENDSFWGEGFTEWHNVAKARSLYPGHVQPVLPGKLGFYDLRSDNTLREQLEYAEEIGVNAFCHWHYWFGGKRVLHGPFERMMEIANGDVKLMLGWANESWTGIWHGLSNKIIFEQVYNKEELEEHAKLIALHVASDRYLKIKNKSPFLIYKPRLIPDPVNYIEKLRDRVRYHGGGDLYIIGTWGPGNKEQIFSSADYGLDAVVANNVGRYIKSKFHRDLYNLFWTVVKKNKMGPEVRGYLSTLDTLNAAYDLVEGVVHSTIVAGWDNTPRSGRRGLVLSDYNENNFKKALLLAIEKESHNNDKIVFVKSWNEWAEGNVMEPKFMESWSVGGAFASVVKNNKR